MDTLLLGHAAFAAFCVTGYVLSSKKVAKPVDKSAVALKQELAQKGLYVEAPLEATNYEKRPSLFLGISIIGLSYKQVAGFLVVATGKQLLLKNCPKGFFLLNIF